MESPESCVLSVPLWALKILYTLICRRVTKIPLKTHVLATTPQHVEHTVYLRYRYNEPARRWVCGGVLLLAAPCELAARTAYISDAAASPMRGGAPTPRRRSRRHSQRHGLIARHATIGVGAQQTSARAQPQATPPGGRSYSPWKLLVAEEQSRPASSSGMRYCTCQ